MKIRIVDFFTIMALLLLAACAKEPAGSTPQEATTIFYQATVSESAATRATASGSIGQYRYVFESEDKLYVCDTDTKGEKLHGVLSLTSGEHSATARFEGMLTCEGGFSPEDETSLSAVLVSAKDVIHTITDDKVSASRSYPADQFAADLPSAISKYGDFTATSTYAAYYFVLSQQSSFLVFNIGMDDNSAASFAVTVGTDVRTANVTPVNTVASFVAAYPDQTSTDGATVEVGSRKMTIADATLAANKYYYINRPLHPFDGFTIKAKENNTVVTLNKGNSFKDNKAAGYYLISPGAKLQYSLTEGLFWEDFDFNETTDIVLQAGQTICLRGTSTLYNGYKDLGGVYEPLFRASALCYLSGDMMSLMYTDDTFTKKRTQVAEDAFNSIFRNVDWVDIAESADLVLSAATLATKCYKTMFAGCTSLTRAPVLPAKKMVNQCYNNMFNGCTNLSYIKCLAKESIGSSSSLDNWVSGVAHTGTFVKIEGVKWDKNASRIPNNWTVVEVKE